jgi:hypothetical protein
MAQAFSQLSQDLQSGNLSAAQQDYSTIQQDVQSQASSQIQSAHGHHHRSSDSDSSSSRTISQLFTELGSALQSGNLSNATSLQLVAAGLAAVHAERRDALEFKLDFICFLFGE